MKTIGFVDYHIDEWHANNYPDMIRRSPYACDAAISLAWEESPAAGGRPLGVWCEEFGVIPAESIKQIVEECDAIIVLAPSNPEVHERLADLPLRGGKPVYIDKPFAPDLATALRLFDKARQHGTSLMSCSALRFMASLQEHVAERLDDSREAHAQTHGGGTSFEEYAIHQIEMLVRLMGLGANRVMQCSGGPAQHMVIDYGPERSAAMTLSENLSFRWMVCEAGDCATGCDETGDFFQVFVNEMMKFLVTGESPINPSETLEVAAILESGISALKTPRAWVDVTRRALPHGSAIQS